MLHLAQVQKKDFFGKTGLRLLAYQKADNIWSVLAEEDVIPATEASSFAEGVLVLVDLAPDQEILGIQEAAPWILEIIQRYLHSGITPAFLQQETERAEQWRQSLTLQSQELDRRALELEARREQIQTLEEDLKREKRQLDTSLAQQKLHSQELDDYQQRLQLQSQELEQRAQELNDYHQRLQSLEAELARQAKQREKAT